MRCLVNYSNTPSLDPPHKVQKDVKELLALANKSRGGFWMGMVIASGIGGLITYATSWLHSK